MKRILIALSLFSALAGAQVTVQPILQPHVSFTDGLGNLCSLCSLYSYAAGTTTPLATYTDSTGTVPNFNPVVLDVTGSAKVWTSTASAYKFVLKDALGNTVWTVDNVSPVGSGGLSASGLTYTVMHPEVCGSSSIPSWCAGSNMGAWINAAFAQCTSACLVQLPAGTFNFATTIALPVTSLKGVNLVGSGKNTLLNFTGSGDAITALGSGQSQVGLVLRDLRLTLTASATAGIHLRAFNQADLVNVDVTGPSSGTMDCVKNEGANVVNIRGGNYSGCFNGLHDVGITVSSVGYTPNAVNTYGTQFIGNLNWGRYVDGTAAAGCGGANGDYGSTYDFNGGSTTGNIFIQCATGHTLNGNYFEFGAGTHASEVQLGDSTHQALNVSLTGNQFFSAGTTTNTINDVNSNFTGVGLGNSEYGAVTNYYNHGTLSRNSNLSANLASAATNYFAGSDSGSDTFGACPVCLNYLAPGSRGIAVNGFEGGANHIVLREGANPDGVITEWQNQGGTQKAKIDNTGWGYFAARVTATGGLELGALGQTGETPIKLYPSVNGAAIQWIRNVNGVLTFSNGAGSGMTPGTAMPFTMDPSTGNIAIQGNYQIGSNTVIPSTTVGSLGGAGTTPKTQLTCGAVTNGHVPIFDSNSCLTDSGATPANRVLAGYCQGVATASSTLSVGGLGGALSTCATGVSQGAGAVMPVAGTLSGLYVRCGTTGVNASSGVFTVNIQANASSTINASTMTITYGTTAANTTLSDIAHPTAVNAGDLVLVKFTTQAAETLGNCSVSITY